MLISRIPLSQFCYINMAPQAADYVPVLMNCFCKLCHPFLGSKIETLREIAIT